MEEIRTVLVALEPPTDENVESKAALHYAVTQFVRPGIDQVILGYVLRYPAQVPTAIGNMPYASAKPRYQAAYRQIEEEKATVFLKDYQEVCRRKNVTAIYLMHWDEREAGILTLVEGAGATHLIMGTGRAKTRFTNLLRMRKQSLTARVAKQARCSVYLIDKRAQLVSSHIYDGKRGPAGSGGARNARDLCGSDLSAHSRTSSGSSAASAAPSITPPASPSPGPNRPSPTTYISPGALPIAIPSAPVRPSGDSAHSARSVPSPYPHPGNSPRSVQVRRGPFSNQGPVSPEVTTEHGGFGQTRGALTELGSSTGLDKPYSGQTPPRNGFTGPDAGFVAGQNELTGPQGWVDADGQRLSGYVPDFREYDGNPCQNEQLAAAEIAPGGESELAEVLRKLHVAEETAARLQAKEAAYEQQLHEAESRATSANSLAEAERRRALVAHQERERARQESALAHARELEAEARARARELEAEKRERASQEAAEKERQARVAERQQAAEHYRALQKAQQQYRTYRFDELEAATNRFDQERLLGEGGFGQVFRAELEHMPAAVKILNPDGLQGPEEFRKEVEILSGLRHSHIVMLMGCCPEKGCIVYEYCANGSLEDRLARKGGSAPLPWYTRVRIAFEVAVALLYMHKARPNSIIHKDLKPSNILLDQNLTSKLGDVGIATVAPDLAVASFTGAPRPRTARTSMFDTSPQGTPMYIDPEYQQKGTFNQKSDVYAFGICLLQILVNRPPLGIVGAVEDALEEDDVMTIVDKTAGEWPTEVATKVASLGLKCAEIRRRDRPDLEKEILPVLDEVRTVALEAAAREASQGWSPGATGEDDGVPSIFLCPISHDIMEDPVVAADGNTYERSEIAQWFQVRRVSPLTNVPVDNLILTPNRVIRSAIREWLEGNRRTITRGITGQGISQRA